MGASYKVPQDVEAEDKLIGPFSFRQFIYLGIVAMAIAGGYGLYLLFPLLAIVPLPIVLFFGALALPLRKDQPMETYLAAMWQFYIKPRQRMWAADGVVSRIAIDVPLVTERRLTKDISNDQALSQFEYLSQIADSGGWSSRGVAQAPVAVVDNPADDILDNSSAIAQSFNTRLQHEDDERRQELLAKVHSGSIVDEAPAQPYVRPLPSPVARPADLQAAPAIDYVVPANNYDVPVPVYSPAPQYMQQHVIQPLSSAQQEAERIVAAALASPQTGASTGQSAVKSITENSPSVATPAIMELAKDVSVETVAKQLHHEEVERRGDEIVINLH